MKPKEYDVIIVGGGSSGCALAGRLSEDPDTSVLLIEAGFVYTSDAGVPSDLRRADTMAGAIPGNPSNWSMVGQLSPRVTFPVARGKVLGGSSALNGTLFLRGVPEDFDQLATIAGPEWSFEEVLPFYTKLENDLDFGGDGFHGTSGPVPIKRQGGELLSPVAKTFMTACQELGHPVDEDKNRPGPPGVGLLPLNAVDGVRVNAAMSYILPALGRPNLTVIGDTLVSHVVMTGRRATAVATRGPQGPEVIVGKEIVLCAGALKSPQILMASGIGPAADLRRLGVEVVRDAPAVGATFIDHPDVWVTYSLSQPPAANDRQGVFQASLNFTAPGSEVTGDLEILCRVSSLVDMVLGPGGSIGALARDRLRTPIASLRTLRSTGLRTLSDLYRRRHEFMLFCGLQQGRSRGSLRITSVDPSVQPEISYNYLSDPEDLRRMREVVASAVAILETPAFRALGAKRRTPTDDDLATPRDLDNWIQTNLRTAFHSVGTCPMGLEESPDTVVDPHFRVYGVDGLRVVDLSVMPVITRRGTSATAVMLGERAAHFLRASTRATSSGL